MESVILSTPLLLIGFGLALFFCVFSLIHRSSGYVFPVISVLLTLASVIASVIFGAGGEEIVTVLIIFILLNFSAFGKSGGKK